MIRFGNSRVGLRETSVEAKRGAKALLDLQDELEEEEAGEVTNLILQQPKDATSPLTLTPWLDAASELVWESPLSLKSILQYPHPKLRAKNGSVKDFGAPLQKLADEMFDVMYQLRSFLLLLFFMLLIADSEHMQAHSMACCSCAAFRTGTMEWA